MTIVQQLCATLHSFHMHSCWPQVQPSRAPTNSFEAEPTPSPIVCLSRCCGRRNGSCDGHCDCCCGCCDRCNGRCDGRNGQWYCNRCRRPCDGRSGHYDRCNSHCDSRYFNLFCFGFQSCFPFSKELVKEFVATWFCSSVADHISSNRANVFSHSFPVPHAPCAELKMISGREG